MDSTVQFEALILSGGKARRLAMARKIINKIDFPSLFDYWDLEGPKGLTTLTIQGERTALLDLHMQSYIHHPNLQQITLGLGFASDMIIAYYRDKEMPTPVNFTTEKHPAGTIAPLLKMYQQETLTNRPLLLANGDNILQFDIDRAISRAYDYAKMIENPEQGFVLNILTHVPHQESGSYGVVDYDPQTHIIHQFLEKQAVENNPFFIEDGEPVSYINSGFSLIFNPKELIKHFVDETVFQTMHALENQSLDYKENESIVKYETLYAKLAREGRLIGEPVSGFWADSGTEEQIQHIEAYYHGKESK
ncbi:NDP-sugar synthase [Entomospira entomophila]|uniref:NDP-sugar synthase n=1 Tax=Entomospira entomophila TaxID=2719988 RepID=A0A968KRM0_9SPIO|nr:NDP-sugar synthase [Entomospira entomophilus]NIZ40888.1 NDP-sugar synthase [Entomospira entomophilus]WDI35101.1 NDP-sugar synthase [Entomospira entomophilus]